MARPRMTIARGMALIALLAVNAALLRAYVVQEMFDGGILIFVVLQWAAWRASRTAGRRRRFWVGFLAAGVAATLALFSTEFTPESPLSRALLRYTVWITDLLFAHLPTRIADSLHDDHWQAFLAVAYFLPELAAALLGGAVAALVGRAADQSRRIRVTDRGGKV